MQAFAFFRQAGAVAALFSLQALAENGIMISFSVHIPSISQNPCKHKASGVFSSFILPVITPRYTYFCDTIVTDLVTRHFVQSMRFAAN